VIGCKLMWSTVALEGCRGDLALMALTETELGRVLKAISSSATLGVSMERRGRGSWRCGVEGFLGDGF
jgi:hypothetical protein